MGIEASPENEANDEENGQKRSASLWRTPGYPSWFTSDTASAIGAAMQGFGVSLVSYKISGSLIAAGWVPTLTSIVRQLANVLGGTIVDRHDRKNLVIVNCIIGVLLWGTTGILLLVGSLTFSVFLAIMLTSSLFTGCLGGATDAMLRSIIDSREYPKARSVNEGQRRDYHHDWQSCWWNAVLIRRMGAIYCFGNSVYDRRNFCFSDTNQ